MTGLAIDFKSAISGSALAGLLALGAGNAQAVVTTAGCANASFCTLQELYDGGSMSVDDITFDSFALDFEFYAPSIDPDDITVFGDDTDALNPGLIFDSLFVFDRESGDLGIYEFSYEADTVGTGFEIVGSSLDLLATFIADEGLVEVAAFMDGGATGDMLTYDDNFADEGVFFDDAAFAARLDTAVTNSIFIEAGPFDLAGLDAWQQNFLLRPAAPAVSEPATLALLGLGFMAMGLARRRR